MTMLTDDRDMDPAAEGVQTRLSTAWHWLCEQRACAPDAADVWDIRWQHLNTGEGWLTALEGRLLRGTYRLSPLQLHGQGAQRRAVWGAQDALVLKWVALSLQHLLPLHPSCEHVKGHGGGKRSIETLQSLLASHTTEAENFTGTPHYRWVCRTDIRGYYRNIRKETLMQQVRQYVISPVLRDLVHQYLHYTVEDGGTFHTPEKGISRGCPLSPLMGALHLYDMDEHFSRQQDIHYARYMDDVIILAKSRWSLRKHTRQLMQWFSEYGFEAHPDKTFIGRAEKGFDWMGAWLTHEGVTDIAPRAKANHREKVRRLYERLARVPFWKRRRAQKEVHARVSAYRLRWNIWAAALLIIPGGAAVAETIYVPAGTPAFTEVWSGTLPGLKQPPITPMPYYGPYGGDDLIRFYILGTIQQTQNMYDRAVPGGGGMIAAPINGPNSRFWLLWEVVDGGGIKTGTMSSMPSGGCAPGCLGSSSSFNHNQSYTHISNDHTLATPDRLIPGAYSDTSGTSWQLSVTGFSGNTYGAVAQTLSNGYGYIYYGTDNGLELPSIRYYVIYVPSGTVTATSTGLYLAPVWTGTGVPTVPTSYRLPLPAFRSTGVTCNITSTPSPPIVLHDVLMQAVPANTIQTSGTLPEVKVGCTGSSSAGDPQLNVGLTYAAAAGSNLLAGRTDAVSASDDPGHYLTLNTGTASCTSNSTSIDLSGATPLQVGAIAPGGTGSTYTSGSANYAFCATDTKASLGFHTIGLTVSSTMY